MSPQHPPQSRIKRLIGLVLLCTLLCILPGARSGKGGEMYLYSEPFRLTGPQEETQYGQIMAADVSCAYGALIVSVDLDALGQQVRTERTDLYKTDTVFYDPARDAYFIESQTLPETVRMDVFFNETTFSQEASAWAWGYALNAAAEDFREQEGRWYFDGLDPGLCAYGQVYVLYRAPITMHTITFFDADGTRLDALNALEGGTIGSLRRGRNLQNIVPQAMQHRYDGWTTSAGEPVTLPLTVSRPIYLSARYKEAHAVVFYDNEWMQTPFFAQEIVDGEAIDWQAVPTPARGGMAFVGWQAIHPQTGVFLPTASDGEPVTQPQAYQAQWAQMHSVVFLDGDGQPFFTMHIQDGTHIDPTRIDGPKKENLTFSHWVDEGGNMLAVNTVIRASMRVTPAYTATVVFLDGTREHARRVVPQGEYLRDVPEAPLEDAGYVFIGWDAAMRDAPIEADTIARAVYEVQAFYSYGLAGEYQWAEQLPLGSVPAPPNASLANYTYTWVPAIEGKPVEGPFVARAAYTPVGHTVRFLVPGPDGAFVPYDVQSVPHGATPVFPANPVLQGRIFMQWDWPGPQSDGLIYEDLDIHALFELLPEDIPPFVPLPEEGSDPLNPSTTGGWEDFSGGVLNGDFTGAAFPASAPGMDMPFGDRAPGIYRLQADDIPMHGIVSGTVADCVE